MGKDIFESAIVDSSILIARCGKHDETGLAVDMDRLSETAFPPAEPRWAEFRPHGDKPWSTLSALEQAVMDKMEAAGTPLKEWDVTINYGIKTGLNEAFIIDEATKAGLLAADPKSADILKPVLRGRDIQRYRVNWASLYLIDAHNGYRNVPAVNIDDYPAIKTYLDTFAPQLNKRQDKGKTPYNLRNCAYHEEFAKEKLFWADLTEQGRFAYDPDGMFCVNTAFMMSGQSIKYLCALLNSKLITWFMHNTALNSGMGTTRYIKFTVERIPIPALSPAEQRPFINLVDSILKANAADPNADVSEQNAHINRLVYTLYDLTPEEIATVEQTGHANNTLKTDTA